MNIGHRYTLPFVVVVLLGSHVVVPIARAEGPDPFDAADQTTAHAQFLFREAVAAFAAERYNTALELFTKADRIQPRPELAYDIARSYEKLEDKKAAAHFYREYLRRARHPKDESEVKGLIEKLEGATGAPESELAEASRVSMQTPSGPFVGGPADQVASSPEVDRDRDSSGKMLTTLGWVGLGMAGAALTGAIAFEVMRQNAESDAEHAREQVQFAHYVDTMETDRTASRVLVATGALFAVTGGVLLFVGASEPVTKKQGPGFAFRVAPGAVAADASWRF